MSETENVVRDSQGRDARIHGAAEAAWRLANSPTPEWGWDALPEDEREAWRP